MKEDSPLKLSSHSSPGNTLQLLQKLCFERNINVDMLRMSNFGKYIQHHKIKIVPKSLQKPMLCHFYTDISVMFSVKPTAKASSLLQSRLLGDRHEWRSAVMTWSRLQGELAASRNAGKIATEGRTEKEERRSEKLTEEGGKCMLESRKRTRELREEESENKRLRSDGQHESRTLNKEREEDNNREAGKEGLQHFSVVNNVVNFDIERSEEKDTEQNESHFKGSRSDHTTAELECTVENCNRTTNPLGTDVLPEHVENGKKMLQ